MLIELTMPLKDEKMLLAVWEIKDSVWQAKKSLIKEFIQHIVSYHIHPSIHQEIIYKEHEKNNVETPVENTSIENNLVENNIINSIVHEISAHCFTDNKDNAHHTGNKPLDNGVTYNTYSISLKGKPGSFYDIQNRFDEYFETLGALKVIL